MSNADIVVTLGVLLCVFGAVACVWWLGQRNPVGTGKLARDVRALEAKVASHGVKLDQVDHSLMTIADSVGDLTREVGAARIEAAGDRGINERTWAAMERLEGYFIQDGIRKGGR